MSGRRTNILARGVRKFAGLNVGVTIAGVLVIVGISAALGGDIVWATWGIVGGVVLTLGVIVTNYRRSKTKPPSPSSQR